MSDGKFTAEQRLAWLHSPASNNVDGYEWGIYRVKWKNGQVAQVLQTAGDFSDLDAAMTCRDCGGSGEVMATDGTGPYRCYGCDENTCRSCTQEGSKLVCTAGAECEATSNPEYQSWQQVSAGAADSHAASRPSFDKFMDSFTQELIEAEDATFIDPTNGVDSDSSSGI